MIIYLFAYLIESQAGGWETSGRLFFCYGDGFGDGWRQVFAKVAMLIFGGVRIDAKVARKGIKLTRK